VDADGELRAVAAWRVFDAMPPILCGSVLVAVGNQYRRNGYAIALKCEMIRDAHAKGAVAISSRIDWRNGAMIDLNREHFGANIERIPEDPENCLCFVNVAAALARC
jgi:hypothetical protein